MRAYFDGPNRQLCIEPEGDQELSMLKLWHAVNNSSQYLYSEIIDPDCIAAMRIVGVTDDQKE